MTPQKKKKSDSGTEKMMAESAENNKNNGIKISIKNGTDQELSEDAIHPDERTDLDHADDIQSLKEKLKITEEEAKNNYDRYLRLAAEFDNFKKRASREKDEFRKYANESIIQELLPVADNLERAIQAIKDDDSVNDLVLEGISMTLKEILKVFEKFKVTPIEALGEPFDPAFHQAVLQEETDIHPENTVLNELQKGYTIHDRLLRPSMVVVSKSATKENDK